MTALLAILLLLLPTIAFSQPDSNSNVVDTAGFAVALSKAKQLRWEDLSASLSITYEWDLKLAMSSYYTQYAEFGLLHAANSAINCSPEAAVEVYERTIKTVEKKIPNLLLASLYAGLGSTLNFMGESEEAFEKILIAKKIYEGLNDSLHLLWADVLIGQCYSVQKNEKKAQTYFLKAIAGLESKGPSLELCDAYNALANNTYYNSDLIPDKKQPSSTKQQDAFLLKSLSIARNLNNPIYIAKALKHQGQMSILRKDYIQSEKLLQQSIQLFKRLNAGYYKMETEVVLGKCYCSAHKFEKTIATLLPASKIAAENGWIFLLREAYTDLAISYYAIGDYDKGALYGGRAFTFYKFISNSKRAFEMDALAAKYEQEKQALISKQKSKELDNSNSEKNILRILLLLLIFTFGLMLFSYYTIKKKNTHLKKLSAENEFLLGEANHRIKNNLQLISSLIAQEVSKSPDSKSLVLLNIQSKIASIAALHHHLYVNEKKENVQLKNYLEEVYQNLKILLEENRIQVAMQLTEVSYPINAAIYIGLLLNELIMNTVKHAFDENQQNKKIDVLLKKENGLLIFTYKDNGCGLPDSKYPKFIKLLCKQLKANFEILPEQGFSFNLTLKL